MSNRKNPVHFSVDFEERKIIGTKASLNKAKRYDSSEYKELCKLVAAHPRFEVVAKEVKKNKSKHTYKALNFSFIEKYISIQPNRNELMGEYEAVKSTAKSLGRSAYPHVKRWFLEKFSSADKPFDVGKADKEITDAATQVRKAA